MAEDDFQDESPSSYNSNMSSNKKQEKFNPIGFFGNKVNGLFEWFKKSPR